ncbi:MAG: ParM/StbA family protein [Butyrivibrio sp.]|uniref:ParM/StbA family protein n=1 Tax=Butyrivibrio sp. TaxID=28121 RepID=UPI001B54C40E|nr:ParM/StbA family protein [Butyrivibrio sp.]MBP3781722.1 ParM/StbA family protein [Butyrivibrio sp.]
MNTKKFKTGTDIIERDNGKLKGVWSAGLDLGYSGVKLFAPNKVARFPSYAVRIDEEIQYLSGAPAASIMYRNNDNGEMWLVGELAQTQMAGTISDESERAMYGRDRYDDPMFNVVAASSLGVTMYNNSLGHPSTDRIIIQTGLPESYLQEDAPVLRDALAKEYNFSLKIGDAPWKDFRFKVNSDDIYVMSQPKGSLFSVCIKNDGTFHEDVNKYLSSNAIIFDPGFGTFDIFIINNGAVVKGETAQNLGMRRVFHDTSLIIKDKYGISIPVPAMQKYLDTGTVRSIDRKTLESKEYPFGNYLYDASDKICDEAIARMFKAIGGIEKIIDYNYLIVTGGTGDAWFKTISEKLKNVSTLKIIPANQNDTTLPLLYSNARGYYYYRLNKLIKESAK